MLKKFKGLKYTEKIITKMCSIVGANPKDIDFKKKGWYLDYSWTEKEQNNFIKWLSDYLYNNSGARKEIMALPLKNRVNTKGVAMMFVLNYGFKLK